MARMGCSSSSSVFDQSIQRHSPDPPSPPPSQSIQEKNFGKVSMLNSDGSVVTTGTIVPEGERTQMFGRIRMNPVLKIKSDDDGVKYDQDAWIAKFKNQVKRDSVYASDHEAGKAYAENFRKAIDAHNNPVPQKFTPRTPRPVVAPVQKTVFGMRQPPPSATPLNLTPLPFKFDLPPLPPTLCLPRLM
jgi:hypothetical protein